MNRPKIKLLEAIRLLDKGETEEVYLIGIRGYYLNTMGKVGENDRGIYDDCICLVAPNLFITFNANTDPSKFRPATKDQQGLATLIPGRYLYKPGKHKITGPHPYDAFRPATDDESLPVWRDGQEGIFKGVAINIHKGGVNTTSSEGCQTIFPDQYDEFIKQSYGQLKKFSQRYIPYNLVVFK